MSSGEGSRKHWWRNMPLQPKCGSWARVTCVKSPGTVCCRVASRIRYSVTGLPLSLLSFNKWAECLHVHGGPWQTEQAGPLVRWLSGSGRTLRSLLDFHGCSLTLFGPVLNATHSKTAILAILLYPLNLFFFITFFTTAFIVTRTYVFLLEHKLCEGRALFQAYPQALAQSWPIAATKYFQTRRLVSRLNKNPRDGTQASAMFV